MAGSGRYTVLLDANVLYPNVLRDLLLSLASAGLYHARWTDRINEEWTRNLVADRPDIGPRIPELLKLVNQSVPDCLVENYDILIDQLELPDSDDRHVLAAAIAGHADAIVTGVVARIRLKTRLPQPHAAYAATVEVRTDFGRPAPSIRLSTATATAVSIFWPRQSRARSLGPMMAL